MPMDAYRVLKEEKEEKTNGVQSSNFIAPNMQIKLNHNHSIFSTVA